MNDKSKIIENLLLELKRGTLVLSVLLNVDNPTYGYSLVQSLQEKGIEVEQNTLYPLLRRLEKQELLSSNWDTEGSRPRKYYIVSSLGTEVLNELIIQWQKNQFVIDTMIQKGGQL